jgi:Caspase domain
MRLIRLLGVAILVAAWQAPLFGQENSPPSSVPDKFRQKFVYYVEKRSIWEKVLNSVGLTSQDVGRSFALIAGVSKYPNFPVLDKILPAAGADIDELQDYLKNQEFFDEIVVLRDADVTLENLEYFLQDYFPDRLKQFPKCRFLFAYSGHGMVEGQTGYLLKGTARSFQDKLNSINMDLLRDYLNQDIKAGYQTLILINACHSGAFLSPQPFGADGTRYIPKYRGAHAITSGGSNQLSWHDPKVGKGSVFFEKLLAGLGGQADMLPVYPDGHHGSGIITVDELAAYLREEVSLATNQDQVPIPADLEPNRSLGGFFFLDRQRMVDNGFVPAWDPSKASPLGVESPKAEQSTAVPPPSPLPSEQPVPPPNEPPGPRSFSLAGTWKRTCASRLGEIGVYKFANDKRGNQGIVQLSIDGDARDSRVIDFKLGDGILELHDRAKTLEGRSDDSLIERGRLTWINNNHFTLELWDGSDVQKEDQGKLCDFLRQP